MIKGIFIGGPLDGNEQNFREIHDTVCVPDPEPQPMRDFVDTWEELKPNVVIEYKLIYRDRNLAVYSIYGPTETIKYAWNQYKRG